VCVSLLYLFCFFVFFDELFSDNTSKDYADVLLKEEPFWPQNYNTGGRKSTENILNSSCFFFPVSCFFLPVFFAFFGFSFFLSRFFAFCKKTLFFSQLLFALVCCCDTQNHITEEEEEHHASSSSSSHI